jgi:hypothetical protein
LPSDHAWALQEHTTKNVLNQFISAITCVDFPQSFPQFEYIFGEEFQEQLDPSIFSLKYFIYEIDESFISYTITYKISPGKILHINYGLDADQQKQLVDILKEKSRAFSWEYTDMKDIHPDTCIHHIYTQGEVRPVRKPQRRMRYSQGGDPKVVKCRIYLSHLQQQVGIPACSGSKESDWEIENFC